jgi:hypothetical protein
VITYLWLSIFVKSLENLPRDLGKNLCERLFKFSPTVVR